MRILGAILAGGQARRFGSDKALASIDGVAMIDRVAMAIRPQVAALIVSGREPGLKDRPAGVGPLGGLAAALDHGLATGFDAVLSIPCDTPILPEDLVAQLMRADGATFAAQVPVVGLWPCTLAPTLDAYLAANLDRSMRGWARACGAEPRTLDTAIANINTLCDLRALTLP